MTETTTITYSAEQVQEAKRKQEESSLAERKRLIEMIDEQREEITRLRSLLTAVGVLAQAVRP